MAIRVQIDMRASISKQWQGILSFLNNYRADAASFVWNEANVLALSMREAYKKVYLTNTGRLLEAIRVVPKNVSKVKIKGKTIGVSIGNKRIMNMRPERKIGGESVTWVPGGGRFSLKTVAQYMEYLDTGRGAGRKTIRPSVKRAIRIPREYFESGLYPKSSAVLRKWLGQSQKSRTPKAADIYSESYKTFKYKSSASSESGKRYARNLEKMMRGRIRQFDKYGGILLKSVMHSRRIKAGNFLSRPIADYKKEAGKRFQDFVEEDINFHMGKAVKAAPWMAGQMRETHTEVSVLLDSAPARDKMAKVLRGKVK